MKHKAGDIVKINTKLPYTTPLHGSIPLDRSKGIATIIGIYHDGYAVTIPDHNHSVLAPSYQWYISPNDIIPSKVINIGSNF